MRPGSIKIGPNRYRESNGRYFEEFTVGDVYEHRPGRTLTEQDNIWFTLLTMNTHPLHFDANYAATSAGVATGIIFSPPAASALVEAAERAHRLYDDGKRWRDMQICAMNADVSWRASARLYADLYRDLIKE